MAQVDSSIYLQQQTPDIAGGIMKGLQLSSLAQQNKMNQQQLNDSQAVRDAFKNNIVTDPDGNSSLNKQGVLSDLAKTAPLKGLDLQQEFAQQDANKYAMHQKVQSDQADLIAKAAGSATDQPTYNQALQYLSKNGIDTSTLPAQYDPNLVKNYQMRALSAKDQIATQQKNVDLSLTAQKNEIERQKNILLAQQNTNTKQGAAMDHTLQLLSSARGDPAVAQAEKDIYASQKANSLANLYGDPNKLNQSQVNLLVQEVGKIASGGSPSMHELDGISPDTLTGQLSKQWEKLTNNPTPANAGAFVKQYQDYSNTVAKDAQKVLEDKYGRVINSNRRRLNDADADALDKNFGGRFQGQQQPQGPQNVRVQAPDGSVRLIPQGQVGAAVGAGGRVLDGQ